MWWCHVPSVFVLKWHVSLTPPCLCLISRHFVSTPDFCLLWLVCGYLSPVCLSVSARSCQFITCAVPVISKSHCTLSACDFDPCLIFDLTLFGFCVLDTSALDSVWLLDFWPLPACWLRDCLFPLDCCLWTLLKTLKLELCCLQVGPSLLRVVTVRSGQHGPSGTNSVQDSGQHGVVLGRQQKLLEKIGRGYVYWVQGPHSPGATTSAVSNPIATTSSSLFHHDPLCLSKPRVPPPTHYSGERVVRFCLNMTWFFNCNHLLSLQIEQGWHSSLGRQKDLL